MPKLLNHCFDSQNTIRPVSQCRERKPLEQRCFPYYGGINYLWSPSSVLGAPEDTNKAEILPGGQKSEVRAEQTSGLLPGSD